MGRWRRFFLLGSQSALCMIVNFFPFSCFGAIGMILYSVFYIEEPEDAAISSVLSIVPGERKKILSSLENPVPTEMFREAR